MKYVEFDETRPMDLVLLGRVAIDFNPAYNDHADSVAIVPRSLMFPLYRELLQQLSLQLLSTLGSLHHHRENYNYLDWLCCHT